MNSVIEAVQSKKILVADGAWGTLLQQKGLQPGECPESWNISHADAVFEIARSYINAGADIVETNSFGGNGYKLGMFGREADVWDFNKAAAEISRKAAGEKLVMGSIGPTGKMLIMEDTTPEAMYEAFKLQAMALEAGGADALVIETMYDLEEALCAIKACRENTRLEIICTFTFDKNPSGEYHTMMGVTPTQMLAELKEQGVAVIGANCGNGMEGMLGIVKELRQADSGIPILINANAGLPVQQNGTTVFPETPEQMSGSVLDLLEAGANIVGGCCGTTPQHISAMAGVVNTFLLTKR